MIMRLLGQVTPWLLALLLGVAVFAGMQARQYATERDAAQERTDRAEQRAEAFGEVMDLQRDQMRRLSSALAEREQQLAADDQAIDQQRDAARRLERDDEKTRDWADELVPAAARDWLRDLGTAAGAGGDDAGRAELSGQSAAGPAGSGEPQPGPAAATGGL